MLTVARQARAKPIIGMVALGRVRGTKMTKRNSPNDIKNLDDLQDLEKIVVDKRNDKRKTEKRNRRDRHYNKLFIKIAIKDRPTGAGAEEGTQDEEES